MKVSPACAERRPGNRAPGAPACRLPVGGYSPSPPTVVQRGPVTEPKRAIDADGDGAGNPRPQRPAAGRFWRDVERGLSLARLALVLPVFVLVLSGVAAFIYGVAVAVNSAVDIADHPFAVANLRLFLTEIDLFLIGATLIIAAIGLYELFIARIDPANLRRPMPAWLQMQDLNDLKARVIAMIILVCAVTFTDVLLEFGHNELEILYLAAGVAIFIIALTIFLRYGSDNGGDHA
jgi:uncharacterized membrane protein YqhA